MHDWKYLIILVSAGMVACQSHTDTSPQKQTQMPAAAHTAAVKSTVPARPATIQPVSPRQTMTSQTGKLSPTMPASTSQPPASPPDSAVSSRVSKRASTGASTGMNRVPPVHVDIRVLARCTSCHYLSAKAKVGPGLGKGNGIPGVFKRKAGTFPGFRYRYMTYVKGPGWIWDGAHLREWICNSRQAIKKFTGNTKAKTMMPPQHVCDPAKQNAVIAALRFIS